MKWWVFFLILIVSSNSVLAIQGFTLTATPENPITQDNIQFKLSYSNTELTSPVGRLTLKNQLFGDMNFTVFPFLPDFRPGWPLFSAWGKNQDTHDLRILFD